VVVKNHLHSSSDVQEAVSGTIYSLFGAQYKQPLDNAAMDNGIHKVNRNKSGGRNY
jgi:hypothetical protein